MSSRFPIAVLLLARAASVGAEAASPSACSGAMPAELAAPAGNALAFQLTADGVQVYSCARAGGAAAPAWALQAPDATLLDADGRVAGRHGAGPSWEGLDGSSVVAAKVGAAPPGADAIPWLLLRATSHGAAPGRMADVTFVQRVQTRGGLAPPQGCSAATLGAVARVPYKAVYCFYRSGETGLDGQGATPARSPAAGRP